MSIEPLIAFCEKERWPWSNTAWLTLPAFKIQIYVRNTKRYLGDQLVPAIDLANFEIPEAYRGQGLFTKLLTLVEEYAKSVNVAVYIECVHNARLRSFLERRGYVKHQDISYFLLPII